MENNPITEPSPLTSIKNEIGGRIQAQYYSYSQILDEDGNVLNNSLNNGKDGLPTRYKISSTRYADYTYDSLNRLSLRTFSTDRKLYNNYIYYPSERNTDGSQVYRTNQLKYEIIDNVAYRYTYDNVGNITKIEKGERTTQNSSDVNTGSYTEVCSYVYDALGQLVRENNVVDNKTYVWNYDVLGNIDSKLVYGYTTGAVSNPETGIDYQYTNDSKAGWKKLLTTIVYKTYSYTEEHPNGTYNITATETVNYDGIGNPTNYQGATVEWFGRQMTSYSKGNVSATFTYDADGLRGSKTVNGSKTTYFYVGDQLMYECRGDGIELYFYYDSYGALSVIRYVNGTNSYYYYVTTNSQGDVLGIYSATGDLKASYKYDTWGNCTIVSDTSGINIATINPIRYRGYYYDNDLGLYYLQSRYYDSTIGRFINADEQYYQQYNSNLLDFSLFVYCRNNPIIYYDYTGCFPFFAFEVAFSTDVEVLKPAPSLPYPTIPEVSIPKCPAIPDGMIIDVAPVNSTSNITYDMKYPSRRISNPTRKKAYEGAKRAGGGKEPIHHPNGHDGNRRPHFHPNVKNHYSKTPHQPNLHDHYYYSTIPTIYGNDILPPYPNSKDFLMMF